MLSRAHALTLPPHTHPPGNPATCATFFWEPFSRSVRIEGRIERWVSTSTSISTDSLLYAHAHAHSPVVLQPLRRRIGCLLVEPSPRTPTRRPRIRPEPAPRLGRRPPRPLRPTRVPAPPHRGPDTPPRPLGRLCDRPAPHRVLARPRLPTPRTPRVHPHRAHMAHPTPRTITQ